MRLALMLASLLTVPFFSARTPERGPQSSSHIVPSVTAAPNRVVRAMAPPLFFERNIGQTSDEARFVIRQAHRAFFFTKTGIVVKLTEPPDSMTKLVPGRPPRRPRATGIRMSFVGAAAVEPSGERPFRAIVRQNGAKGSSGRGSIVPSYQQLRYAGLYSGADIVYYEREGQLHYDVVFQPGSDPSRVRLHVDGARAVRVDEKGNLIIQTALGDVVQSAPQAYQQREGRRVAVRSSFVVRDGTEVSFRVDDWDRKRPLVIDPVVYVRLLAPDPGQFDHVSADNSGNLFVIGFANSATFPSTDGSTLQGTEDVIAYRFDVTNPASPTLAYARYLGGVGAERPGDVAASGEREVFVAGTTDGSVSPGASTCTGPEGVYHTCGFVARLDELGAVIADAIIDGGAGSNTTISGIAVREGSSISAPGLYVIGSTDGSGRPGALRPPAGGFDGFVAKLKTSLHTPAVAWFSYLGGALDEKGSGIHVVETATSGTQIYATGRTSSTNFPTSTCSGGSQPGNTGGTRGFAAVLDAVSGTLRCAAYVHVADAVEDAGEEITANADGIATVVGRTAFGSHSNALIARVNADGTVAFARAIGGDMTEARAVTQDGTGKPVVVGMTSAAGLSTPGAIQSAPLGWDAFLGVTSLATGSFLDFTYLGASGVDAANDVAAASSGYTYIVGFTNSDPFRVGGVDPVGDRTGFNSFLLVIGPSAPVAPPMVTIETHHDWPDPVTIGTPVDYFAVLMRNEASLAVGDSVVHHLGMGAHLRSLAATSPDCQTNAAADRVACPLIGFFTPSGVGTFNVNADVTIAGESCDDLELKGPSFPAPVHDSYYTHVNAAPVVEVLPAALTVTKTVAEMSGGFITYGIVIQNTGTLPATDVIFTDFETVASESQRRLNFIEAQSDNVVCTVTLLHVTCPLHTISGSSTRHVRVRAKIRQEGSAINNANVVFGSGMGTSHTITTDVRFARPNVDVLLRIYPPTVVAGAGNASLQSFAVSVLQTSQQPSNTSVNLELEFYRETCFESNTNPPRHICSSGATAATSALGGPPQGLEITVTLGGGGCTVTSGTAPGVSLVRCELYPNAQSTAYQMNVQVVNHVGTIVSVRGFAQESPLVVDLNRMNNCASWPAGQPCLH